MKRNIIVAIVVALLIILAYQGWRGSKKLVIEKGSEENTVNSVNYDCDGGKQIHVIYFDDKVELNLSDKRNLLLMQAVSASGTRYTNGDQSVTFWSKGNGAWLEEKDKITFDNCIEGKTDLKNKKWLWQKTELNDGKTILPKKEGIFGVEFKDDGSLEITTDCNQMGGKYKVNEAELTINSLVSTKMYCEDSQEDEFAKYLQEVKSFVFDQNNNLVLELRNDSGTMIFE